MEAPVAGGVPAPPRRRAAWPLLLALGAVVGPGVPRGFAAPAPLQRWHPFTPRAAPLTPTRASRPVAAEVVARRPSLGILRKALLLAAVAVAGLVALLYVTSGFEVLMESATGTVKGKSPLAAGLIGLAVGALHTFAGPDHLAGLAPLVIGQRRSPLAAFGLGALWGSGHATGQLLLGLACLGVHFGLVRESWGAALGQVTGILIGAALVAIGLLGLHETRKFNEEGSAPAKPRFGRRTYLTGVLHGLSLDAILFITPALTLPKLASVVHVTGVALGTLLSMGIFTTILSRLATRGPRLRLISGGASSVAILLGACIVATSLGLSLGLPGL